MNFFLRTTNLILFCTLTHDVHNLFTVSVCLEMHHSDIWIGYDVKKKNAWIGCKLACTDMVYDIRIGIGTLKLSQIQPIWRYITV